MVFILAPRLFKSSIQAYSSSRSARRAAMSLCEGTYHHTPKSAIAIATTATLACCQAARHSESRLISISALVAFWISGCKAFSASSTAPRAAPFTSRCSLGAGLIQDANGPRSC
jgi:hypothetical protein